MNSGSLRSVEALRPVEALIVSTSTCGSRPKLRPIASASQLASRCTAESMLLSAFNAWPAPTGPTWRTVLPSTSSSGRHALDLLLATARHDRQRAVDGAAAHPRTPARRRARCRARRRVARARASPAARTSSCRSASTSAASASSRPSSSSTAPTTLDDGSISTTASAPAAASRAGRRHARPRPRRAPRARARRGRSRARRSPRRRACRAIGRPILPRPMKATTDPARSGAAIP